MENNQEIIKFVRQTLGCQCPDEVFKQIEQEKAQNAITQQNYTRITVGGRLLIYIWKAEELSLVKTVLPELVAQGKSERDRRGMNRFRLVLAAQDAQSFEFSAAQVFRKLSGIDEKVHLHIVDKFSTPFINDNRNDF